MSADAPPGRSSYKVLHAAALYFVLVFVVGLLLGPPRVLWFEPWLGKVIAVLLEAPFLLTAMWLAARAAPKWADVQGGWVSYLAIGMAALLLQQMADLAVGFGFRGMNLADQLAYFGTPAGAVYVLTLIVFALMPLLRMLRSAKSAHEAKLDQALT